MARRPKRPRGAVSRDGGSGETARPGNGEPSRPAVPIDLTAPRLDLTAPPVDLAAPRINLAAPRAEPTPTTDRMSPAPTALVVDRPAPEPQSPGLRPASNPAVPPEGVWQRLCAWGDCVWNEYLRIFRKVFDEHVLPDLKAHAIILSIIICGLTVWMLERWHDGRKETAEILVRDWSLRHEKREEAMQAFADGIPKNVSYLSNLRRKVLWLDWKYDEHAKGLTSPVYFDGRFYPDVSKDFREELQQWRQLCPHYTALCEQVRGRFGGSVAAELGLKATDGVIKEMELNRQAMREAIKAIDLTLDALNEVSMKNRHDLIDTINAARRRFEVVRDSLDNCGSYSEDETVLVTKIEATDVCERWQVVDRKMNEVLELMEAEARQASAAVPPADTEPPRADAELRHYDAKDTVELLRQTVELLQILALRMMHADSTSVSAMRTSR